MTRSGALIDALAADAPDRATPGWRARDLAALITRHPVPTDPHVDACAGTPHRSDTEHTLVRGISRHRAWAHLTVLNRNHRLLEAA